MCSKFHDILRFKGVFTYEMSICCVFTRFKHVCHSSRAVLVTVVLGGQLAPILALISFHFASNGGSIVTINLVAVEYRYLSLHEHPSELTIA